MKTSGTSENPLPALARRVEQLEEANRLRDEFFGKLAHELGNLFLPYQFAQQLLQHAPGDASTAQQVCEMLEDHHAIIQDFLADLRAVSRLVRRKMSFRRQPVDLKQIVEQSLAKAERVAAKEQITLSAELPGQPFDFEGDPTLLGQMIDHLLSNARKFNRAGGGIWLTLRREGDEYVLRVRDSGVGIEADYLPRLFTPFAQADPMGPGWGAGLTIVRGVAELHGGRAQGFSPGPGEGSEFLVVLPGKTERTNDDCPQNDEKTESKCPSGSPPPNP